MKLDKPSWANWKAMDANSSWYWYEEKPHVSPVLMSWGRQSRKGLTYRIKTHPITHIDSYWKDTLTYVGKEEEMKDMRYDDLKAGMRVETRNGEQGLVIKDGEGEKYLLLANNCSKPIQMGNYYSMKLKAAHCTSGHGNDIMSCYPTSVHAACDLSKELTSRPTWERKEVKELTVAEIEKLLGHSVKIVK